MGTFLTRKTLIFSVQMQLALVSQEFRTVLHWEEELQGQYRITFLNLINIYLDSLVQQKIILEEGKKEISDAFSGELKSKALEWKDMISEATKVGTSMFWIYLLKTLY